jgi:SnoaL-like domain
MLDDEALGAIDALRSHRQINDACFAYCRALDRLDEALLRSVFHPDSTHRHDAFTGTSADFCGFALGLLKVLDRTQHLLGNVLIDIAGEAATAESYFVAYHRIAAGVTAPGLFAHHMPGIAEDCVVGGRYVDRFERRNGVWKIAHRVGINEWETWRPASERQLPSMPDAAGGRRDRDDWVYRIGAGLRHFSR